MNSIYGHDTRTAAGADHDLPWFLRPRDTEIREYREFLQVLRNALAQVVRDPTHDDLMAMFLNAYGYRRTLPWLSESNEEPNWIGGGGLGFAIRYALQSYHPGANEPWGDAPASPASETTSMSQADRCGLLAATDLLIEQDEVVVKGLANALYRRGHDPDELGKSELIDHVVSAFEWYARRPSAGISTDPW